MLKIKEKKKEKNIFLLNINVYVRDLEKKIFVYN